MESLLEALRPVQLGYRQRDVGQILRKGYELESFCSGCIGRWHFVIVDRLAVHGGFALQKKQQIPRNLAISRRQRRVKSHRVVQSIPVSDVRCFCAGQP